MLGRCRLEIGTPGAYFKCDAVAGDLCLDIEIVAMLMQGFTDRRLLRGWCRSTSCLAPRSLHPYTYSYVLRLARATSVDSAEVVRALEASCGETLFEAAELELPGAANEAATRWTQGERRWRLDLNSPGGVFDERAAYAVYQRARLDVADRLGVELA